MRAINVKEGQLVHAGDVLAELDPTFAQADMGSLEAQVSSLQAEVDRLTAETQNRPYLSDGTPAGQLQELMFTQRHSERSFKLESFAQQIELARVKLVQAASDVASFTERLKLAAEVEAKRRELERMQVGSQLDRLQSTDTRMNAEAQLAMAKSQVRAARSDLEGAGGPAQRLSAAMGRGYLGEADRTGAPAGRCARAAEQGAAAAQAGAAAGAIATRSCCGSHR